MAYVARPIQQLNLREQDIWMLDWFGGLVQNPKDFENPSIECVLTKCTPDPGKAIGFSRQIGQQVVTTIGVSAINAIGIGRRCLNGNLETPGLVEETNIFRFDPKRAGSVQETVLEELKISDSNVLVNRNLAINGFNSPVKIVDGLLISTTNCRSIDKDASTTRPFKFKVMFHELEIIRFYYTNSPKLVRAVFNDSFQGGNLNRDVVFSNHQGPHCLIDENKCRFEYQLGFCDDDLAIIGRVLFDSTETALHGVRRVFQSTHVSKVNEVSDKKVAYPRTLFPYLGEVEMMLKGRRLILKDGGCIFAVHSIVSCNAPFPFDVLSVQRSAEPGGEIKAEPGSPVAFSNTPPRVSGPGQKDGEMDTENRPLENSGFAECIPDSRRFLGLKKGYLCREKARSNTHLTAENPSNIFDPRLTKSSPGTPTSGQSEAVNQKIIDTLEGSDTPVDLNIFIAILSKLKDRKPSWIVSTISFSENTWRDPDSDVTYCGFPSISCPERKSVFRQFSFHDKQKKQRRYLICAQILADNKFVYLLEAERRQNDQGKDMEALPILVLWLTGFLEIENHKFQSVLAETVKNPSKTWPQDVSAIGLMRGAIEHRRESKASKMDETLTEAGRMELGLKEAVERIEKVVAGVLALAR